MEEKMVFRFECGGHCYRPVETGMGCYAYAYCGDEQSENYSDNPQVCPICGADRTE